MRQAAALVSGPVLIVPTTSAAPRSTALLPLRARQRIRQPQGHGETPTVLRIRAAERDGKAHSGSGANDDRRLGELSSQGLLFEPEVFKALRRVRDSPQERGRIFERVMRAAFERNPQYSDRFAHVWLWADWPARSLFGYGGDSGVDLVAEEFDGGVCAIQCKLYEAGAKVPSSDIDSFLAEAGKEPFTSSLLVTTGGLTAQSWSKIESATKRCEVLSGYELDRWPVRWSECFEDPEAVEFGERAEPRIDQVEALEKIAKGFGEHDRGQVHMPCGTGKSLVALWAAEQQVGAGGRVLYLVPSIALMAQTMRVWAAHRSLPHRYGAVCSDVTTGRRASATKSELAELLASPSTNP